MNALFKCPKCGAVETLEIPEKSCLAFHKCKHCDELIGVPEGECCIICAYSDKTCLVSGR